MQIKFVKYLTALFLIIVLFDTAAASSVKITNAGSTTIQSPFTTMPPTIDGILSTNEWNNAAVRTFTLSYPNESYPATLYVMNDGFNLYFAMTITDNDYHYGDHIAIGFNNRYDFLYIQANGESYDGHQNSSGYTTLDTEQGGSNDIVAKAAVNILTNNNVNYVFEISHPFNSVDDSNDISLYLGDSVNISVLYLDMNRGFTSTNSWTSVLILGSGTSTPTPTPAASETTVSISNTTTTPNSNITRSITVENVNNLATATIWLTYDPNVVKILSVSTGDFGGVTPNIDNTIGKVTMSAFSTTAKSGSVTFANLQLKAVGSLNTTSPLTLTVSSLNDQNGAAIPYTIKNGTFTISSVIKGDVSGDGTVTIVDALFVAQYTVGTRTLTSSQLVAADVNGDGQVTIVDALFMAQYTVGLRQL